MKDVSITAARIKNLREQMNMNQRQFSEFLGIKQQTLSSYERGSVNAPVDGLKNIAQKCKVSMDWLCGLSDKQTSKAEYTTYADILRELVAICDYSGARIYTEHVNFDDRVYSTASLVFDEGIIQEFISEWEKMFNLYQDGTIDNELYMLWVDNKLNDNYYKKPLLNTPTADENLPF